MNETGEPKIVEFIFPETLQIIYNEPKPFFYDNSGDLAAIEFCSSPGRRRRESCVVLVCDSAFSRSLLRGRLHEFFGRKQNVRACESRG